VDRTATPDVDSTPTPTTRGTTRTGGPPPQAVVFDLDGVVTFTARRHLAAWKDTFDAFLEARAARTGERPTPFTDDDYRAHVDGRPRFDGVRAFLAARDIELPEGGLGDPADRETVHGLGNRKNELFRERVRRDGVEVDPEAVRFAEALRDAGIRVGVASSSRNTELVLEAAGLTDLFEARVDGVVSERLGLRGKPAPDIFVACLERLGDADPSASVIIEDALVGVEAGRAGGFGLVLGVDRGGRAIPLREHGADWVVPGFGGVGVARVRAWFREARHALPNALAEWQTLAEAFESATPAVFLDYDGTLSPITDHPDRAVLSDAMRETLGRLARAWPTTVVSGRGREDVEGKVGIPEIHYAGSHGFDISGPRAEGTLDLEVARESVPAIAAAAEALRERTRPIEGVLVEDKKYSVAVHYRLADDEAVPEVERIVGEAADDRPELTVTRGKKILELRPAIDWDKGRAVLWLLDALGLARPDVLPIYIGDDVTDEDAFRALRDHGVGVLVSDLPRPTAARYSLQDVREVRELLDRLAALGREGTFG
jgi:alpha,alpha-trehalase